MEDREKQIADAINAIEKYGDLRPFMIKTSIQGWKVGLAMALSQGKTEQETWKSFKEMVLDGFVRDPVEDLFCKEDEDEEEESSARASVKVNMAIYKGNSPISGNDNPSYDL